MAVHDLLGFFGDDGGPTAASLGAAKFAETINEAMDFVRTGLEVRPGLKAKTQYHDPGGDAIETEWLPGFRFYILGPPRDKKALDDTGEHGSSELYGLAAGLHQAANFCIANPNAGTYTQKSSPVGDEFDRETPFDVRFRCFQSDPLVQTYQNSYFDPVSEWRRVDTDWLNVSADLALQLDSSTNNTSLAMAIERISDGKVLLFPADAQQGNWLSWHDDKMEWTVNDGSATRKVKIGDLLARTVFYKTGHHASHNATAKAKGLELMKQEAELTAFIPVDRAIALKKSPPGSWRMPARPLYLRLLQKCQGRVVRADLGWANQAEAAADKKVEQEFLKMGTAAEWATWRSSQKAATHVDTTNPLYMEYTLN
jgi:hypothetical protein